jgi:hypothetical protein
MIGEMVEDELFEQISVLIESFIGLSSDFRQVHRQELEQPIVGKISFTDVKIAEAIFAASLVSNRDPLLEPLT